MLSPVFRLFSYVSYFVISCYLVAFVQDNEQEVRKEAVRVIEACLNLFGSLNPSLGESLQLKTHFIQIRCIFLSRWRHHTNHMSDMSGFSVPQILDDLVTFRYVPLDLTDVSVLRPEPLTSEQLQQHILS